MKVSIAYSKAKVAQKEKVESLVRDVTDLSSDLKLMPSVLTESSFSEIFIVSNAVSKKRMLEHDTASWYRLTEPANFESNRTSSVFVRKRRIGVETKAGSGTHRSRREKNGSGKRMFTKMCQDPISEKKESKVLAVVV